ncbi:hypothetical protein MMC24_002480 [Lignoscripta atroalba]|nr:hypothetical protein [Lignoscripta atroalba]
MEVVSATASIAGIVSLAGQSIDGIIKLRNFFLDVSSASQTIELFLQDLNSLLRVLYDVERLLCMISASDLQGGSNVNVASLRVQLQSFNTDLVKWLRTARDLRPESGKRQMIWAKKLWVGINQSSVNNIRGEIGSHKQTIELNLSVLGRKLDLQLFHKINQINGKVDQLRSVSRSTHDASINQQQVLERIESYSRASVPSSAASIRSLGGIASSSSTLEPLATSSSTLPRTTSFLAERNVSNNHHYILQQFTEDIYPKPVADYISSSRLVTLFESQLYLINASVGTKQPIQDDNSSYKSDPTNHHHTHLLSRQQEALNSHLTQLRADVQLLRKQCLQSGHSLYEINQTLLSSHPSLSDNNTFPSPPPPPEGTANSYLSKQCTHSDMLELRKHTLSAPLLGAWTTTRDRINSWLLHSLRSDDTLARLHRTMLVEQDLHGEAWAKQVLRFWTRDEAATGGGGASDGAAALSYSGGVTDRSWEGSSLESADEFETCWGSVEG